MKGNFFRQHRWTGLVFTPLLLFFCFSGMILNHRDWGRAVAVSRQWLPEAYAYRNWNNASLRTSVKFNHRLFVGGDAGCWAYCDRTQQWKEQNEGLPAAVEGRQVRSFTTWRGRLFLLTTEQAYVYTPQRWLPLPLRLEEGDHFTDMTALGDSLVVVSRSALYLCKGEGGRFQKILLKASPDHDGKTTLFRWVWQLHSGELFGTIGRWVVDALGILLVVVGVSGGVLWLVRRRCVGRQHRRWAVWAHLRLGNPLFWAFVVLCASGWLLRPPGLPLLAAVRVPEVQRGNPWHDRLRMLRYDHRQQEWVLAAEQDFYVLGALTDIPRKVAQAPPISVMGATVLEQDSGGVWWVGSFSGGFRWDREKGTYANVRQGVESSRFVSDHPVSGFIEEPWQMVDYHAGTKVLPMPAAAANSPMSLRHLCLEIHTGRLFAGRSWGSFVFVFLSGILVLWCLWTGRKLSKQ